MEQSIYSVPTAKNEPILSYAEGTKERDNLKQAIQEARSQIKDIPMFINGKEIRTDHKVEIRPPHNIKHLLGHYHKGDASHVKMAIEAALEAKESWEAMPWKQRASIFLRAAGLIAGPYRAKLNAATMLGQSKNAQQAEIDAACELIDFLRFNVQYMSNIYKVQPESYELRWNRFDQRPGHRRTGDTRANSSVVWRYAPWPLGPPAGGIRQSHRQGKQYLTMTWLKPWSCRSLD